MQHASRFESRRHAIWTVELEESSGGGRGASGRRDRCFQFSLHCSRRLQASFSISQSSAGPGCLLIRDKLCGSAAARPCRALLFA